MKNLGIGIGVALVLLLAGVARAEDLSGAAYSTCQMFALDRLPSRNIHFPGLGERGTGSRVPAGWSSGHYQVLSFVDSRTPAGASVRRGVYCELRFAGDDRWILDRLVIEGDRATVFTRPRSATASSAVRR